MNEPNKCHLFVSFYSVSLSMNKEKKVKNKINEYTDGKTAHCNDPMT